MVHWLKKNPPPTKHKIPNNQNTVSNFCFSTVLWEQMTQGIVFPFVSCHFSLAFSLSPFGVFKLAVFKQHLTPVSFIIHSKERICIHYISIKSNEVIWNTGCNSFTLPDNATCTQSAGFVLQLQLSWKYKLHCGSWVEPQGSPVLQTLEICLV